MVSAGNLLSCLLEVDKSLARGNTLGARMLLAQAEDHVLGLQQEVLSALHEKEQLQRRVQELTSLLAGPPAPRSNIIPMPAPGAFNASAHKPK